MSRKVAIITARGGSKRIPRKNIKSFDGRPIIAYSIEACLKSEMFDEVMVSTDDDEIANISTELGAKVPFVRSRENADDFSGTRDVLVEVIKDYESISNYFDYFCCVYPTAPFVTPAKLKRAFDLMKNKEADFCIPVTEFAYPVQRRLNYREDDNSIGFECSKAAMMRSQDLKPFYHDTGQFYWGSIKALKEYASLFSGKCIGYLVPPFETQDIDVPDDWDIAEFKYRYLKNVGRL